MIDAVVLAAGASRRMGRPKALLQADGTTFLERAVQLLRTAGCRYVVAVVNDDDWIERLADVSGAAVVINDSPDAEQIDSLRLGLANLPEGAHGVLVLPVDFPRISLQTVRKLIDEFERNPGPVVIPSFQGTTGHPVLFASDVVPQLLEPDLPTGARTVIERYAERVRSVDVDDEGVLLDVDTPADYDRIVNAP